MDSGQYSLQLRLDAIRTAQERSRLALLAATVVSLAILTACWNAYVSLYRQFALGVESAAASQSKVPGADLPSIAPIAPPPVATSDTSVQRALRQELLAKWVQSRMISIALLGIHVGIDDATTIGAVAVLIVLYWLLLCVRREHFSIAHLLRDYANARLAERRLIFYGINSYTVFTNVQHSDVPVKSLDQEVMLRPYKYLRVPTYLMFWLPAITLATLLLLDMLSVFVLRSPFRDDSTQPLYRILLNQGESGRWQLFQVLFCNAIAIALIAPVSLLCLRIVRFAAASEGILRDFWASIWKQEIEKRAFRKWEAAGRPIGNDLRFWLEAEREMSHGVTDS